MCRRLRRPVHWSRWCWLPSAGCWWPLFITPQWMQSLAKLTPHGWANGGFNKLMLFGAEFGDVTQEMVALAGFRRGVYGGGAVAVQDVVVGELG